MIVGMDADTKRLAVAAVERGKVISVWTIKRRNTTGRTEADYGHQLTAFIRRCQDRGAALCLEGIYLPPDQSTANVKGFAKLAEVHGEVKHVAAAHGVPVVVVSPNAWHKTELGFTTPRAKLKEAALAKAQRITRRDDLTEHEADAVCIALHGETTHQADMQWAK